MDEEIFVSCHAPCLALLLFETARSLHDQKGLLIGQICNEIISKKTDENEVNRESKTAIYLEHCIPIENQDIIGHGGSINKNQLQKLSKMLQNKIVGWYSFRRNSNLLPNSLCELLIHQSFLELLPNCKSQYFVACFMSSNTVSRMSTHSCNHVFTVYNPNKARFEPLKLKIYTLSDKSVNSNGYLMKNPFPTSSSFDKIIDFIQDDENPVKSVLEIHQRIRELLKNHDRQLQTIENQRVQLELEVEALKKKLTSKKKEFIVQEPEKQELKLKTIQYDPNIKYNLKREKNPLNAVVDKPMVPVEVHEQKRKSSSQEKNYSQSKPNASPTSSIKCRLSEENQKNNSSTANFQ